MINQKNRCNFYYKINLFRNCEQINIIILLKNNFLYNIILKNQL